MTTAQTTAQTIAPQGTIFARSSDHHYEHRMSAAHIAEIIAEQRAAKLAKKKSGTKLYFFSAA